MPPLPNELHMNYYQAFLQSCNGHVWQDRGQTLSGVLPEEAGENDPAQFRALLLRVCFFYRNTKYDYSISTYPAPRPHCNIDPQDWFPRPLIKQEPGIFCKAKWLL